jgi:hypothetical protein
MGGADFYCSVGDPIPIDIQPVYTKSGRYLVLVIFTASSRFARFHFDNDNKVYHDLWFYKFLDSLCTDENFLHDNTEAKGNGLWSPEESPFYHGLRRFEKDLYYSKEDVESSCRFVLFCPCKILEDGTMIKYREFNDPRTHPLFLHHLFFEIN